jgi:hypothetical protein
MDATAWQGRVMWERFQSPRYHENPWGWQIPIAPTRREPWSRSDKNSECSVGSSKNQATNMSAGGVENRYFEHLAKYQVAVCRECWWSPAFLASSGVNSIATSWNTALSAGSMSGHTTTHVRRNLKSWTWWPELTLGSGRNELQDNSTHQMGYLGVLITIFTLFVSVSMQHLRNIVLHVHNS